MMNRLRQWMYGRYGGDELGIFSWIFSLALLLVTGILSAFITSHAAQIVFLILRWVSVVLLVLSMLRMLSRKHEKRRAENYRFLSIVRKLKGIFRGRPDAKTHCYFKCPSCRQQVRVPRNKGKISITCPKCGTKFIKKT